MSDRDALIRRICETSHDITARLVFADWLDDHEELDRAEFIRLQVESPWALSRPEHEPADLLFDQRPLELLYRSEEAWLGRWWPRREEALARPRLLWQPRWRRGFAEQVSLGRGEWRRYGPLIVAVQPITELCLLPEPGSNQSSRDAREAGRIALAWARQQECLPPLIAAG